LNKSKDLKELSGDLLVSGEVVIVLLFDTVDSDEERRLLWER
jgi:hypothetical protein